MVMLLHVTVLLLFRVLTVAVDKSTTVMPLVFFNNCFDDKKFNNGQYSYTVIVCIAIYSCNTYIIKLMYMYVIVELV